MDMLDLVRDFASDAAKAENVILNAALDEDVQDNREESVRFNLEYQIFLCQRRQAQLQTEINELREQVTILAKRK